tara:strand:+ start:370 stop:897 length:528 start_codon:yes stop_codon:yes gene_type:complete
LNPKLKTQFLECYNDLIKYADKQYKRNAHSIDIVNDLYIYLMKNPLKADSSTLSAFCHSYIYNQCRWTYKDPKHKYSNATTTSIDDFFYLEDKSEDEVQELSPEYKQKLYKISIAKDNMNGRLLTVYELYYEKNYRYTEIVEMTGISLGDVYNRIKEIEEFINTYVEDRQQLRII